MFAKLLKHERKATGKLLGILSLAAIGVAVVATVCLRLLIHFAGQAELQNPNLSLVVTPILGILLFFAMLALVAYTFATQFLLLYRFYKNKFTDEGYLTFTLPVSVHQILLAGWLNMLFWTVISGLTMLLSVLMIALFGTAEKGLINQELLSQLPYVMDGLRQMDLLYTELYGAGYLPLTVLTGLIQLLTGPVICIACITIGSVAAKKHKILMSFAIYYIYTMLLSMGSSAFSAFMLSDLLSASGGNRLYLNGIWQLVFALAIAVFGYFFSAHLMKNKLNLP